MSFEETLRQIIREELERALSGLRTQETAAGADQPVMVTVPEAARMLGLSKSQAYEMVARGVIPTVRFGPRNTRVPVAALKQLHVQQQIASLKGGRTA